MSQNKILNKVGSNSLEQLIGATPFRFCTRMRNLITYANKTNIVEKNSPKAEKGTAGGLSYLCSPASIYLFNIIKY